MSIEQVTPEWIAELRRQLDIDGSILISDQIAVFDALTAARAEVRRLTTERNTYRAVLQRLRDELDARSRLSHSPQPSAADVRDLATRFGLLLDDVLKITRRITPHPSANHDAQDAGEGR